MMNFVFTLVSYSLSYLTMIHCTGDVIPCLVKNLKKLSIFGHLKLILG